MIGMWGSRGAGKSVYLAALYYEILRHWEEDERWRMRGNSPEAHDLIVRAYEIFSGRSFPPSTSAEAALPLLSFEIAMPLSDRRPSAPRSPYPVIEWFKQFLRKLSEGGSDVTKVDLEMFDPSGDLFRDPERLMGDIDPQAPACRQMLANCDALICMIDPERSDGKDYFPVVYRNFVNLSVLQNGPGGGPLEIPVAICVAKSDQYPNAFDDPKAFLRELMGSAAFFALADACPTRAYFAVSAVGHDNITTGPDGALQPKGEPRPINVLEPIQWLAGAMR